MDNPYRMDLDALRRQAEGRLWACALDGAAAALGPDAARFTLLRVLEALRIGAMICGWPDCFALHRCEGVLLARAGYDDEALALCAGNLAVTPARWEAATVHAAIAARRAARGDRAGALACLRGAAGTAAAVGRIYERVGETEAVYDLFTEMGHAGLGEMVDDVADTLGAVARPHVRAWRADWSWAQNLPLAAEDRLVAIADAATLAIAQAGRSDEAIRAAGALANRYVGIATLAAIAQLAVLEDDEVVAAPLECALDLLAGSFGDEGRRALLYDEETRFTAALGLGAAIRSFAPAVSFDLAHAALARARGHDDAFAGGALVYAAGVAAIV